MSHATSALYWISFGFIRFHQIQICNCITINNNHESQTDRINFAVILITLNKLFNTLVTQVAQMSATIAILYM